jgi:aerobic-type carbon monoxide dehydrogenase small subunit (CoxS/CutS family)
MSGHICRCGTYLRILRAIERAAREAPSNAQHVRAEP